MSNPNSEEVKLPPILYVIPLKADTHTTIIFDWDDTLFASTYLLTNGYDLTPNTMRKPELDAKLVLLERTVSHLLSITLQLGNVYIITNSENGWVGACTQKYMPTILPWLQHIPVLSARSTYENQYPGQPQKWKEIAFYDTLQHLHHEPRNKDIIAFGDAHIDRHAAIIATNKINKAKIKNIKLIDRPTVDQLQKQLELIIKVLPQLYHQNDNLDLMLSIQQVKF